MPFQPPLANVGSSTTSTATPANAASRRRLHPQTRSPVRRYEMERYPPRQLHERHMLHPWLGASRRRLRSPDDIQREDNSSLRPDSTTRGLVRHQHTAKRRRVEEPRSKRAPIKYGHYGQVEAGRLKLELISCDGGEHIDPHSPATSLGPQNVLRHDQSVYCSERPHANFILSHADDTPFCLEQLNIVAPDDSFTAPVREGLVYVGMTLDNLTPYIDPPPHAQRLGIDTPPYRLPARSRQPSQEHISLSDAPRDPHITAAPNSRNNHASSDGSTLHRSRMISQPNLYYFSPHPERYCNQASSGSRSDTVISADGNGRTVTVIADADVGPEETSSQDVLDFRAQRLRATRWPPVWGAWPDLGSPHGFRLSSNDRTVPPANNRSGREPHSRSPPDLTLTSTIRTGLARLDALMARAGVDDDGESATNSPDANDGWSDTWRYLPGKGAEEDLDDPSITAMRFRMSPGGYKLAIHFDPPVSGRFILLKLWAHKSNVDVQSIVAQGYGGCRFFPAINLR